MALSRLIASPERSQPWEFLAHHVRQGSHNSLSNPSSLQPLPDEQFLPVNQRHNEFSESQQTAVGDWYYGGDQSQLSQAVDDTFVTAPSSQLPQSQLWEGPWDESQREVMLQVIPEKGDQSQLREW
ncbi:hypothetical protein DACRYDRAFT_90876 [Dacryopinax primogenitus]|uniref:Uncharacterized protein n=1 Tax=Dacryopinax primogenitus (strain DJM 731) TaxID=1858805 RepID=M5FZ41_DACPD|nr:uncharacterized protein DACRYDRAFT_90876 [Dacryopinax primogenitus]EJT98841.1 hypothetical protein DACRYDRAFT_90876 [Dacryopinax primogenitus]